MRCEPTIAIARIMQDPRTGSWRVAQSEGSRSSYRMNVGAIVEEAMLEVRLVRSRGGGSEGRPARPADARAACSGEIEEYFIEGLTVGDTFVFAGEVLRFEALAEDRSTFPAPATRTPKCRPIWAASFRSRPFWPSGCG